MDICVFIASQDSDWHTTLSIISAMIKTVSSVSLGSETLKINMHCLQNSTPSPISIPISSSRSHYPQPTQAPRTEPIESCRTKESEKKV